ncbi:hypothetical protein [Leifsonia shinshuensis]|uniref:Uncharacterized protein n=1 Tax=Leifsonia shinshuensis TaxID=150026 RepID=A0A7G6YBL4_9MICO|nr:hypothetical protein [Leifsonia shinshuensis]QNE35879.1 hypothetical protein F1C12_12575 [Leifsonia shinshuensis]
MRELFQWPTLKPLEECMVAEMTLANLGVRTSFWTGWSQIGMAVAAVVFAARPGAVVSLKSKYGSLKVAYSHGSPFRPYLAFGDELQILADGLASVTCEVCGRPGEYRGEYMGVYCETDNLLRTGAEPVRPQMPYLLEIQPAADELRLRQLTVPKGWSQLAYEIVRAREKSSLASVLRFVDAGDRLKLTGEHDDEHWARLQVEVEESSAATCRRCGRELDEATPGQGTCAGCRWLDTRGFEIVAAFVP